MKFPRILFVLCLFAAGASAYASEVPPSFADLVEKLSPAVVNISSTQKIKGAPGMQMFDIPEGSGDGGGGNLPEEFRGLLEQLNKQRGGRGGKGEKPIEREVYSLGSGFVINEDGYIATNNHVIADAEEITVILSDNTKLKAKIVGRDTKTDLALLKVDAGHKLPAVTLGDSDKSRVGDWVIAIGNPYGFGGTVTAGIISARARNINAGQYDDFIQTDAAINRGNSGGPLFNMKGEVIGINSAIFSPSGDSIGIGFAVPTALAKPILDQLRQTGHIKRGWLGVKIQPVSDEIADSVGLKKPMGALVMEVTKDSPAGRAGIQAGDVITRYDGKEVKEMRNLPLIVADTPIGKTVEVEVWREGKTRTLQVTTGELKEQEEAADEGKNEEDNSPGATSIIKSKDMLGMSLATITPEAREKYGLTASARGVVVTRLKPDGEPMKRGLQPGDVITQVGDTPIATIKDFSDAVANARKIGRKFMLLRIYHSGDTSFVTLPVEDEKGKKEE